MLQQLPPTRPHLIILLILILSYSLVLVHADVPNIPNHSQSSSSSSSYRTNKSESTSSSSFIHQQSLDAFIREINQKAKTWVAGYNKKFGNGRSREEIVNLLLGWNRKSQPLLSKEPLNNRNHHDLELTLPKLSIHTPTRSNSMKISLPANYSSVTNTLYSNCTQLHHIRDQGECGACWAFGVSEMVADRFCIASQTRVNVVLSPQFLLSCDEGDCYGGDIGNTLKYVQNYGIVTNHCIPFLAKIGSNLPCPNRCLDGSNYKLRYKVKNSQQFDLTDIQGMQQSILQNGPIVAAFNVFEDFLHFKGGIYQYTTGGYVGGHVVKGKWRIKSPSLIDTNAPCS